MFIAADGQDPPPVEGAYRMTLSLVVDKDGMPKNITVAKKLGFGLDEKAMEAVTGWRFVPGQKDRNPVPVFATIQVKLPPAHGSGVLATGPGRIQCAVGRLPSIARRAAVSSLLSLRRDWLRYVNARRGRAWES